jgi:lipopolysaccharide biosynthesis glycosyltransferase
MKTIDIVVGFDQREAVAYHVFCQSVLEKASRSVRFLPLVYQSLVEYDETHADGSNSFTYSRFLCPYLMNFTGRVIYADGDMICNTDIAELWDMYDGDKAVQVTKHDYLTKANKKYFDSKNENYPRKNWSSLIIWNCGHLKNRVLTPKLVSDKPGSFLHRFAWLEDTEIGELPKEWNWLATEYDANEKAKLIHYTLGTPCFREYRNSDFSSDWHTTFERTIQGMSKF